MKKKYDINKLINKFFFGNEENMEKFMEAYINEDYKLNENGHKVYTIEIINGKGKNEIVDFVVTF